MSLLDRVQEVCSHSLVDRVPLWVGEDRFGLAGPDVAAALAGARDVFQPQERGLMLHPRLADPAARSSALAPLLQELFKAQLLHGWWNEAVPVRSHWHGPTWLECERGAQDPLGLLSFGVHLNAYVRDGDALGVWVARRARNRRTWPGRLDHLAAGGQPAGISRDDNMRKEAHEEAGLTPHDLRALKRVHALHYRMSTSEGLSDDVIFVYDLELPATFMPRNLDGEVESFELMSAAAVREQLRTTQEFKPNVALVVLDFLLRQGAIPAGDPEHASLQTQLRPLRGAF